MVNNNILGKNRNFSFLISFIPFISFFSFISPVSAQNLPLDYSYCGYQRSEQPIPSVKVAAYVLPSGGDDATTLQAAIDQVSAMKPDKKTGLRGAILLGEGTFVISEPLRIRTSGVVLRGSGRDKTILRKTGYDRGAALYIEGLPTLIAKDTVMLADSKPGTMTISAVNSTLPASMQKGARILVWRPSTAEWIASLDCASFGGGKRMGYWAWHPGHIDLRWHRHITTVNGSEISLDAPLTCSIDGFYGGAKAIVYEQPGLVSNCGIENLS